MEEYAAVIGDDATEEDYIQIATYFEKAGDNFKAGQFYHKAGQHAKVYLTCRMSPL